MAVDKYYPPVGFHFRVEFQGVPGISDQDIRFQEVSGLSVEIETEAVKSGGENRFTFKLPTRSSYSNAVLKRGLIVDSALINWINDAVTTLEVEPITLVITLLNEAHEPLQTYNCVNAYPLKWSVADFNAQDSKVVVETMEWYYQYFKIL